MDVAPTGRQQPRGPTRLVAIVLPASMDAALMARLRRRVISSKIALMHQSIGKVGKQ